MLSRSLCRSCWGIPALLAALCPSAAHSQNAIDITFQTYPVTYFCSLMASLLSCQHWTAGVLVELTSDSYMAGIRS